MPMTVGCFALVDPFSTLDHQLDRIRDWGFRTADVTDTSDGAVLGNHFGFSAVASLDANPFDLRRMFEERGLRITSYCAHADLLDATAPWRYGTSEVIKAVRSAAAIGVPHVITTEGEPETSFGRNLTHDEAIFTIVEKLHEPVRIAEDHGVKILIEPHGPYTGNSDSLEEILNRLDSPALAVNLDTGNTWLAGSDPVEYVRRFGERIEHVHWKDLGSDWVEKPRHDLRLRHVHDRARHRRDRRAGRLQRARRGRVRRRDDARDRRRRRRSGLRGVPGRTRSDQVTGADGQNVPEFGIGQVGLGSITVPHREGYRLYRQPVVAGFDPDETARARFHGDTPAATVHGSLAELLQDPAVGVIDVATPHHRATRLPVIEQIAAAGKPFLVQKPLAMSYVDALELVEIAETAGVVGMVNQNMCFTPSSIALMKAVVSDRVVGEPSYAQLLCQYQFDTDYHPWFGKDDRWWTAGLSVHHLGLLQMLFGPPETVFALTGHDVSQPGVTVDGWGHLALRYPSGLQLMLVSTGTYYGTEEVRARQRGGVDPGS